MLNFRDYVHFLPLDEQAKIRAAERTYLSNRFPFGETVDPIESQYLDSLEGYYDAPCGRGLEGDLTWL